MKKEFEREALLLGDEALEKLSRSHVAVFGVGGVGSYAVEAIARSGVGHITIIDNDTVSVSNINRQLCALHSTLGKHKVDAVRDRIMDINPNVTVTVRKDFILPDNADSFDFSEFDYVIDAIDTVSGKLAIAVGCNDCGTAMISCMGTGNKQDPTAFKVTDISKTDTCPLARVMRRELRSRGITHLPVVYSTEVAMTPKQTLHAEGSNKTIPGSLAFVPPVAGLIAASEAIKFLINHVDDKV